MLRRIGSTIAYSMISGSMHNVSIGQLPYCSVNPSNSQEIPALVMSFVFKGIRTVFKT